MSASIYLAVPLMALLAIVQSTIAPRIVVFGVVPQLFFLITIAWSLKQGFLQGVAWAFIAGVMVDLFSATPTGATALALMTAVAAAALLRRQFPEDLPALPVLFTGVATLVFWLVYLFTLRLLVPMLVSNAPELGIEELAGSVRAPGLVSDIAGGYGLTRPMLAMVLPMAAVHAMLMLPVYWGLNLMERVIRPRRVEI